MLNIPNRLLYNGNVVLLWDADRTTATREYLDAYTSRFHEVAEKQDFTKKKATLKEESSPKQARMLSSLSYSHILENLERKAFKEGVGFFTVNPAMTSIIGKVKFAKRYGLSIHHAAALCIVRRLFGFSEAPSKCPMKVLHKNIQVTCLLPVRNRRQHVWKFWREVNRKLKTALAAHIRGSQGPQYCRS